MNGPTISAHRLIPWLVLAVAPLLLEACSGAGRPGATAACGDPGNFVPGSPPAKPLEPGNYKVGNAYRVDGKWYYPKVDLAYEVRGIASWYGPNFHGRRTANGEIFDMNLISAAHKSLPMPSVVRVTNLKNGRSLVIRINDRGPFVRGRIIDLSRRAAELLGFTATGTAMVHVRLLYEESRLAALEACASSRDMVAFGQPAPTAVPSIPVSVEALAPVDGVAVSMLAPAAARTPQPVAALPVQAAAPESRKPVTGQGTPPPYGGMAAVAGDRSSPPAESAPAAQTTPAVQSADARYRRPAPIDVATLRSREKVELMPVKRRPSIFIQAGAFRQYVNANRLRARLTTLGHPVKVTQVYVTNQPFFRVRLGPLGTVEDADLALDRVVALGYPNARIVID